MLNNLNRIAQDLSRANIERYWLGFQLVAYAVYDKNNVYLFNHPNYPSNTENTFHLLKWSDPFISNTIILFEEYPTAIVNVEFFDDYPSLYSVLVHELFHGYQYVNKEKRFPNELLGIMYPLTKENLEMRNKERENLFSALFAKNKKEKERCINTFVSIREKRATQIKDYISYEYLIETVEGPAWYVEAKAYFEKALLPYDTVLKKYTDNLLDNYESALHIRKSCYSTGLAMCLLLDEIYPNWQKSFFASDKSLFELFKQLTSTKISKIDEIPISKETERIMHFVTSNKEKEFNHFYDQTGFHVYIEGNITTKTIDPMNITFLENKLLHKNFIKIIINNEEFLIQQPVIAYIHDSYRAIKKLHLILKQNPIIHTDSIKIDGIGEIKGVITKQDKVLTIVL